jgi:hypothetical protein
MVHSVLLLPLTPLLLLLLLQVLQSGVSVFAVRTIGDDVACRHW